MFRPGRPDIDTLPAEQLPRLVQGVLEEIRKPGPVPEDFPGAVARALAEAQARIGALRFAEAARGLDDALAEARAKAGADARNLAALQAQTQENAKGHATLLAERGRVSRLQLRYREAAGFYTEAATALSFDPAAAWANLIHAGNALYDQGNEFGDNAALMEAIAAYTSALVLTPRERVPLDWATTQNNLGNALQTLGAREGGTARLEEAAAAFRLALTERTRERVPLDWAFSRHTLGNALAILAERTGDRARLVEAIACMRDAAQVYREGNVGDWLPEAEKRIEAMEAALAAMKQ